MKDKYGIKVRLGSTFQSSLTYPRGIKMECTELNDYAIHIRSQKDEESTAWVLNQDELLKSTWMVVDFLEHILDEEEV